MKAQDADLRNAKALVVDPDPKSRRALVATLRGFGVGVVEQLGSVMDARRVLGAVNFDILLLEQQYPDEPLTGQGLVDELRLAQQLPLSTVVVLFATAAPYTEVAEAAEAALDAYLIKPYDLDTLRGKLLQGRQRKRDLQPILDRIEAKAFAEAAALCRDLAGARGPGWVQAARIGTELFARIGDAKAAMALQEAVLETKALPWTRTGLPTGDDPATLPPASGSRRTLESLLAEQPGCSDAYDLMCRSLLEQGDPQGALKAMRRASQLTPSNVPRLQKLGVLAFFHGEIDEAVDALQRASDLGLATRAYDLQGLVLLGVLQFDLRQSRQLQQTHSALARVLSQVPSSLRLNRFQGVLDVLRLMDRGRADEAIEAVRTMLRAVREPVFDFEAACNLLMLLARLAREGHALQDIDEATREMALRFAVSKAACELLVSAARREEPVAGLVREAQAQIARRAEEAVAMAVKGQPLPAVEALLQGAELTLNGRLLDLADHSLQRHALAIGAPAPALRTRIDTLRERYHSYGAQLRLVRPA